MNQVIEVLPCCFVCASRVLTELYKASTVVVSSAGQAENFAVGDEAETGTSKPEAG